MPLPMVRDNLGRVGSSRCDGHWTPRERTLTNLLRAIWRREQMSGLELLPDASSLTSAAWLLHASEMQSTSDESSYSSSLE
jgi:hypothetical protein